MQKELCVKEDLEKKEKKGIYKSKKPNQNSFFFGTQLKPGPQQRTYLDKQGLKSIQKQGCIKYTCQYMSTKYPILFKTVLIIHLPVLFVVILVLFMAALIYCFFVGIFMMAGKIFEEFGWFGGILIPVGILIEGIEAAFFPWVTKPWIVEIHYFFWVELANSYFEGLMFSGES